MTLAPLELLALFGAGLAAGTLNVIAGGGSMLTLPIMIFLGLPATVANGTNRVAILLQNIGATGSFHRRNLIPRGWLVLAAPPAVIGAVIGSLVALKIGDVAFERVLAGVLVVMAAWMLWKPKPASPDSVAEPPTGAGRWLWVGAFFLVGFYGGFIQAGLGFIILALAAAGGLDLVRGNAMKAALVLLFTPVTLALFAFSGMVAWIPGFALAAGNFLGALLGVRMQVLKGQGWVRGVVTAVIVVFAVRLLFFS